MPCQGRGKESSAPPHPLPGGVLIQPPSPTRLQRVSPASISMRETFPEPLSQGSRRRLCTLMPPKQRGKLPNGAVMHKTGGGEEGCGSLPPPSTPFPLCPYSTTTAFPKGRRQNTITAACQREGEQLQQRLVCHDGCWYSGHRHLDFHSTWKTPTLGRVTLSSDSKRTGRELMCRLKYLHFSF